MKAQVPASAAGDVASALRDARALGIDRLDAQLLLARALGRPRSWLLAHADAPLAPQAAARYAADVARRADSVPLAYLLGEKEFHGLTLRVTADVLVPRPDTETLVEWALDVLASLDAARRGGADAAGGTARPRAGAPGAGETAQCPGAPPAGPTHRADADANPGAGAAAAPLRVADLGTGSGAIALAIAHACAAAGRAVEVCAVDASAAALEVARGNACRLGQGGIEWLHGDWWAPLAGRCFDLVVSNPPYVAAGDPHLAALRHEPLAALASGADGLDDLRRIVAGAPAHLAPGGWLLVEHGHDQGAAVETLLRERRLVDIAHRSDLGGNQRCTGARKKRADP